MAQEAKIDGNLINDDRPLAVEEQGSVPSYSAYEVLESGVYELIGPNDRVDQNEYSTFDTIPFSAFMSGEILSILLVTGEVGTGAILTPRGTLYVFDASPGTAAGDAAISNAVRRTLLGQVEVLETDWESDASGASAYITCAPIPFHSLDRIYVAWFHESATSFNDAAGDDESLYFNLWYRRDE